MPRRRERSSRGVSSSPELRELFSHVFLLGGGGGTLRDVTYYNEFFCFFFSRSEFLYVEQNCGVDGLSEVIYKIFQENVIKM